MHNLCTAIAVPVHESLEGSHRLSMEGSKLMQLCMLVETCQGCPVSGIISKGVRSCKSNGLGKTLKLIQCSSPWNARRSQQGHLLVSHD